MEPEQIDWVRVKRARIIWIILGSIPIIGFFITLIVNPALWPSVVGLPCVGAFAFWNLINMNRMITHDTNSERITVKETEVWPPPPNLPAA